MDSVLLFHGFGSPAYEDFRLVERHPVAAANGSGQRDRAKACYKAAKVSFLNRFGAADGYERVCAVFEAHRRGQRPPGVGQLA